MAKRYFIAFLFFDKQAEKLLLLSFLITEIPKKAALGRIVFTT